MTSSAPSVLRTCPIMSRLVDRHVPMRLAPRRPFPSLVDAIVSQQISGRAAETIMGRLRTRVGLGREALATADSRRLRAAGLSKAKARAVKELARFALDGGLRGLDRLEDAAVVERLVEVRGIGVWTAEMFLLFTLHRPDVWPVGDGGVQRAAAALYGVTDRDELQSLGDRFRPWRSHATWYLWRSLGG
jgi:DNA-3-methyladenine glycosylase II